MSADGLEPDTLPPKPPPTSTVRWTRITLGVFAYAGLLVLGQQTGAWLNTLFNQSVTSSISDSDLLGVILGSLYTTLMAIPFVPGIEFGLAMMFIYGQEILLTVYLCTVGALVMAYLIGRLMPIELIARMFASLGLVRA
ncbi:MAG: hypothetical protein JKY27_11115 [Magnetovibrio sp.]|nr:hypothetical protein [Magnetovibrio sp.]